MQSTDYTTALTKSKSAEELMALEQGDQTAWELLQEELEEQGYYVLRQEFMQEEEGF